ncbi:MAG: cell division protein FtsQ/DivIB [Methylohalobius sp.]
MSWTLSKRAAHWAWVQTPIRHVRLEGQLQHLSPGEVEKVLRPLLEEGYWGLDLSALGAAVKQLPWVDEVRIERIWPDVLKVWIKEQIPYVRWGEKDLLNPRGEKFTPPAIEEFLDLPRLDGPEGHEKQLFAAYCEMAKALGALQFKILRLEEDARRSWQLTLESAAQPGTQGPSHSFGMVVVLGRKQPQDAFARAVRFLARLSADQRQRIQRLDARYEHGLAVRWRKPGSVNAKP